MDVIAEQLKFRACLKILMTELRTLATGYEVDGGKLRFQLYSWLEKEIGAMHRICNYKVHTHTPSATTRYTVPFKGHSEGCTFLLFFPKCQFTS